MSDRSCHNLVLIGYRGSGKTTVGRLLAARLGWRLADSDAIVEAEAGRSIAEIFADCGEPAFRRLETAVIGRLASGRRQVISAGGGAVESDDNVSVLRAAGVVVWLTAAAEVLWQRIDADRRSARSRPDLTSSGGFDEVRDVLARREPLYRGAADVTIDTTRQTADAVAEAVLAAVAGRLGG